MKVNVRPIVTCAHSTFTKEFVKELVDLQMGVQVETTQTTTLLRSTRILRRILVT